MSNLGFVCVGAAFLVLLFANELLTDGYLTRDKEFVAGALFVLVFATIVSALAGWI